jgi:hypothetical protein
VVDRRERDRKSWRTRTKNERISRQPAIEPKPPHQKIRHYYFFFSFDIKLVRRVRTNPWVPLGGMQTGFARAAGPCTRCWGTRRDVQDRTQRLARSDQLLVRPTQFRSENQSPTTPSRTTRSPRRRVRRERGSCCRSENRCSSARRVRRARQQHSATDPVVLWYRTTRRQRR